MKQFFTSRLLSFAFLIPIVILSGCNTTEKIINSGNYDVAIARSVNKLRKNKNKEKQVALLKEAYDKATRRDLDRIQYLKQEGASGNSVEVFRIYSNLQERQDKIRPLMPLYLDGREVPFTFLNIDQELIVWKREAATFLFESARELVENGDKYQARDAYDRLVELKSMYPNYEGVDQLMNQAYNKGMNWVLFDVVNRSPNLIPLEFVDELYTQDFARLQGKWFTIVPGPESRKYGDQWDHKIEIVLDIVDVGPEQVKQRTYTEKKEVQDGFQYVYDEKGNVKKDSLGNDMKVPKYKEISAEITETEQMKASTLRGRMMLVEMPGGRLLNSDPINVNFLFQNFSATFVGNKDALSDETKKKIGNRPVPFPSDFQMVMDGSVQVRPIINNFVRRHTRLLES
jgi:hypothetical protein